MNSTVPRTTPFPVIHERPNQARSFTFGLRLFLRWLDSLLLTLERLWQHKLLVLLSLIGLSAATTLALSLPLYVDAVNSGLLSSRLGDPRYAFRFRYVGSWQGNVTQADIEVADAALTSNFTMQLDMPVARSVQYTRGGLWNIRREDNQGLGAFGLGLLTGVDDQIEIVAGEWPATTTEEGVIPVLVAEEMLYKLGIQVGDTLTMLRPGADPLTVHVAALWKAHSTADPTWIFRPSYFDNIFLTQPEHLWQALDGMDHPVEEAAWYLDFDGSSVRTSDIQALLGHISDGQRDLTSHLPGTEMDISPVEELRAFNDEVQQLTRQLIIVVVPVAGLVLYFVSVIAGLLVSRQQHEDVVLRSRGMSRRAILGNHLQLWLILAGIAFAIGLIAAPLVVKLVGRTSSFLEFNMDELPLSIQFTQQSLLAGAITSLLAASSGLFIAWRTSKQTITSIRQESSTRAPWWQRAYLDLLFLIPAGYVFYTLREKGGLATSADNPFSDPLTFLGPTLFALGLTLLFLRLWPFLLRLLVGFVAYTRGIALLMALRELTRSMGRYRGALLMMCFTLSLAGYTASMASTIDRSLEDTIRYRVGADSVLVMAAEAQTEQEETDDGETTNTVTGFNTLPASDLLNIQGVYQVSRVGSYRARLIVPGQRPEGTLLGIDRAAMATVAYSRNDFATEPYADLFNRLAGQRNGILISAKAAEDYDLEIGQEVTLQISALDEWYETKVPIVGILDYFPTLDPNDGFFVLTNLDPIFELVGTELPHNFWLRLLPNADLTAIQEAVQEMGYPVLEWRDPQTALDTARAAPARRGVLGFLSVGFIASIALTLIVAITQNAASFRAQSVQLGSLRAMGLSGGTVALYLIFSQGLASLSGILGGTAIGVLTTNLYLPLLDFSNGLPPYLVRVAWDEITLVYAVFAAILLFTTLFTTILLGRESLAAIVKLGDA